MKYKEVDTVTDNERYIRLRVYDGELPATEASRALLDLYKVQLSRVMTENLELREKYNDWNFQPTEDAMKKVRQWNVNAEAEVACGEIGDLKMEVSFTLPMTAEAKNMDEASAKAKEICNVAFTEEVGDIDIWSITLCAETEENGDSLQPEEE